MTLFFSNLDLTQAEAFQDLGLRFPHMGFFFRLRMVMSKQVQDAVDDQKLYFRFEWMRSGICLGLGAWDRDEDIADITRTRFRVRFRSGKGKHICRRVDSQIISIELTQAG